MRRHGLAAGLAGLATLLGALSCADDAPRSADGVFHWSIATEVVVDAPPARVWSVLVDLPAYREWNPFIVEAGGEVVAGQRLRLRMALPGRDPMTIEPRLLVVEPERELRWKGRLGVPGLFDAEHAFVLHALDDGRTRVDHVERFTGVLLPIARPLIHDATVAAFHSMNAALARRARTM
jgi:hypothetical protein